MSHPATAEAPIKERVFDEHGRTIAEIDGEEPAIEAAPEAEIEEPEETDDPTEEPEVEASAAPEDAPEEQGKWRVGSKYFKTQAEALTYAETLTQQQPTNTDAYRQGIQDAAQLLRQPTNVAPTDPNAFDADAYFADPAKYLRERDERIRTSLKNEIRNEQAQVTQAEAAWAVFASRHPDLADFRDEVENFAGANKAQLAGITQSSGFEATCDYMALKIRAKFDRYLETIKPRKVLANARGTTAPSGRAPNVTPKKKQEQALSMSQQIRSVRQGKR